MRSIFPFHAPLTSKLTGANDLRAGARAEARSANLITLEAAGGALSDMTRDVRSFGGESRGNVNLLFIK